MNAIMQTNQHILQCYIERFGLILMPNMTLLNVDIGFYLFKVGALRLCLQSMADTIGAVFLSSLLYGDPRPPLSLHYAIFGETILKGHPYVLKLHELYVKRILTKY